MKKGCTRLVFLVGKYAIKIPNFQDNMTNFLLGCCANWRERDFYKKHIKAEYEGNLSRHVAPSLFCSWLGLLQVQVRCKPLDYELNWEQKEFFKPLCWGDNKKENFGIYKGKLVCLDYA